MIVATRLKPNDPEEKRRSVIMTGTVLTDLRHSETRDGAPKISFKMRYIRGVANRDDKEMQVHVVGFHDAMEIAKTLEKGDVVLVCGTWQRHEYITKNGLRKMANECRADFLLPLKAVAKVLCPDYKGRTMQPIDERRLMGADYEVIDGLADEEGSE